MRQSGGMDMGGALTPRLLGREIHVVMRREALLGDREQGTFRDPSNA